MNIALDLLGAPHIGVREFKEKFSALLKQKRPLVVTEHGTPTNVVVPYGEMLEILDLIEEINDPATRSLVLAGREAIQKGKKGIPVFKR
ncbi:MAG: type II toxin-antitoxin system prevent-host-death family antitoxin [Candidatus Omnitrophica bacterium]|nr:type II toxin-antitoxin system prevent-host-death family antitoxin [Candidatus Omnitrophota bacterium]